MEPISKKIFMVLERSIMCLKNHKRCNESFADDDKKNLSIFKSLPMQNLFQIKCEIPYLGTNPLIRQCRNDVIQRNNLNLSIFLKISNNAYLAKSLLQIFLANKHSLAPAIGFKIVLTQH